jgi:hypothetical protein
MPTSALRLLVQWIVGVVVGTAAIAVTSPLFVRSYLPLQVDPLRGVWTLPPDSVFRWRSEGYADTAIGAHGMAGRSTATPSGRPSLRVALWGDSQAEGVCVVDYFKIHQQAERRKQSLAVLPLARSGEHAAVWLTQIPAVEKSFAIDVHVMLIVDLPDLLTAPAAPLPSPSDDMVQQANAAIAARLPAFVIQGARNLLEDGSDGRTRTLRFSLGPVDSQPPHDSVPAGLETADWPAAMQAIRNTTDRPLVILYAPLVPQIVAGRVVTEVPRPQQVAAMRSAAEAAGLVVVDLRESLLDSMRQGNWPHGFHNGFIGSGHLNADGNRLVARALVDAVNRVRQQAD